VPEFVVDIPDALENSLSFGYPVDSSIVYSATPALELAAPTFTVNASLVYVSCLGIKIGQKWHINVPIGPELPPLHQGNVQKATELPLTAPTLCVYDDCLAKINPSIDLNVPSPRK